MTGFAHRLLSHTVTSQVFGRGAAITGFDTAAELSGRLDDRAKIWQFLGLFISAWDLPDKPVGGADESGMPLPDALREAYTHTGLLDPRGVYVEGGVLAFHWSDPLITETTWGIPLDAVGQPDPPVIIDTGSGWQPYLDRLSLACVDIALTAVIDVDVHANAAELSPEQEPMVAAHFDRVALPDLPMWVGVEESPVRWYSRPGQLVRVHGEHGVWAWVRGQAPADLDAIYTALSGASWSH